VSCRFVASTSGGQGPFTYSWTFTGPAGTATATGTPVSPDLGCNLSAFGAATFNVTAALQVTQAGGGSPANASIQQQIVRPQGSCGV
jgi:hypothetical protein